jgi:peptidoglycan-N-acetylglucosamine deacetylase
MNKAGTVVFTAICVGAIGIWGALLGAAPARAESCPGNPDALGTSRTIVVSPKDYKQLGTIQYPQSLPLADHEVVITFDDGPLPPWSYKVLDILNSQCVKATFFIIGKMAQTYPDVVRREYESGNAIGTHSQDHPLPFEKLPADKLNYEIDAGVASVSAALGDRDEVAPFFRIPGFGRSDAVEDALAKRGLVVFCADVVADDWLRHITPAEIVQRAMSRLEKRGRGILLLHDIHPWTVAALPEILKQLKQNGFHVVQMVPPPLNGPEIAGGPKAWALAAAMPQPGRVDAGAVSPVWPQSNANSALAGAELPAPDMAAFDVEAALKPDFGLAEEIDGNQQWPTLAQVAPPAADADLPVPGLADIGVSLREARLVATEFAAAPKPAVPMSVGRARRLEHKRWLGREGVRHVRLRMGRPEPRARLDGHRA